MAAALDTQIEGSVWFIIVVSIIAAIGVALLKAIIQSIVDFFVIKKRENEDQISTEVSKISVIIFIILAGLIAIWQREAISDFLGRSSGEIVFSALLLMILGFLIAGVVYREPSKKWKKKLRRKGKGKGK